jgi:2-polyprenyl-3-methyl-5-hydroxy-6-metoxy-1,4-benzoquinol methylase
MNSAWFEELIGPGQTMAIKNAIWRLHKQDNDQFFADYLQPAFWKELESASTIGWQTAVEKGLSLLHGHTETFTREYFFSSYRSDFVELLGLERNAPVLDLGCGWGFASQRCLQLGATVVGCDMAVKRLEFCAERFKQQGYTDQWIGVELDANRSFPFRENGFDAVIVSGVMEWLPCSTTGNPRQIQKRFMQQCHRVIKPGGRLYLAIENRFWRDYFFGGRDLHTLQRFVSILPRNVARAYSIISEGEDYRAWTYSLLEYLRWFRSTGYRQLTVIYPEPDYIQPKKTTTLASNHSLTQPEHEMVQAFRRDTPNRWAGLVGRSFMFIATK